MIEFATPVDPRVIDKADPLAEKRRIWNRTLPDQQTLEVDNQFLEKAPRNFLEFAVKESRRVPITRWVEACMVVNDIVLAGIEADKFFKDKNKGADLYEPNSGTVIIGPGFGAQGRWYRPGKTFLENAGYKVVIFGENEHNLEPLETQIPRFTRVVEDEAQKAGAKVNLWLHSKAGILGYGAHTLHTRLMVENVNKVAAVGTGYPKWVNPLVLGAYYGNELVMHGHDIEFAKRLNGLARSREMEGLDVTTISKPTDPIMRSEPLGRHYTPVEGSHIGNGWSLETLRFSVGAYRTGNEIESKINPNLYPKPQLALAV